MCIPAQAGNFTRKNRMTETKIKVGFEHLPAPIVQHLQKTIFTRPVKPHHYHVTEIIYCLMKAWYRRTHPERTRWTTRSLWNICRGNTFDKKWTPLFGVHQKNYRVTKGGITITGTSDFLYNDGDGDVLYDLKMPASTFFKKREGAGQGYRHQVQAYLALAHDNGELTDTHRARVLMVAEDVVVEEVEEWEDMLDEYLWPRAQALDMALQAGVPTNLPSTKETWECNADSEGIPYCPADHFFRKICRGGGIDVETEKIGVYTVISTMGRIRGSVRDDELFDELEVNHGIDQSEAVRVIGFLMKECMIYSPRPGYYKVTT